MTSVRPDRLRHPGADGDGAVEVVEYTDPACPWAWGSEPAFRLLRALTAGRARWRRVFGILFDEDDDPAPDPAAETAWYGRYITDIARHTRAPYAHRLGWVAATSGPPRSPRRRPSGRARRPRSGCCGGCARPRSCWALRPIRRNGCGPP
ncbi:DsbA family protein (plasmid) [Streptomyces rapamycinicus]